MFNCSWQRNVHTTRVQEDKLVFNAVYKDVYVQHKSSNVLLISNWTLLSCQPLKVSQDDQRLQKSIYIFKCLYYVKLDRSQTYKQSLQPHSKHTNILFIMHR